MIIGELQHNLRSVRESWCHEYSAWKNILPPKKLVTLFWDSDYRNGHHITVRLQVSGI